MRRRYNYTGRQKIKHSEARIAITPPGGGTASFDVALNLSRLQLPAHAPIWIEAYYHTQFMRFAFGTVGHLQPPTDRRLRDFPNTEAIHFRVKVVDPAEPRRLLAEADQIPLASPDDVLDQRVCLLHIKPDDLGHEVWKLELSDGMPMLLYNNTLSGAKELVRSDPRFHALVYPMIVRQVLQEILLDQRYGEADSSDADDWRNQWVKFMEKHGVGTPPEEEGDTTREREDWIDQAVQAFCRRSECLKRFVDPQEVAP